MPSEFHKSCLDNGLTLVAERHPHVCSVCIGVWVRVGSTLETPANNGISHFIEHMVFKGTEKRTAIEIATVLESLGGDLNAFTDREFTCFHATALKEHLDVAMDVISDLVLRPAFERSDIERERRVLLREMSMVEETPDDWINDIFFETIWASEPLGQTILGTRRSIKRLTRANLVKFFREYYRSENMVISVAGNIDFDDVRKQCEKYFAFAPAQKTLPLSVLTSKYHARKRSVVADTEQTHLMLGFGSVGFKDPYRFEALILSFFLGGGMSSRLFQEIREKAALAYTVDCDYVPFSETGAFSVYVALSARSVPKCLEILRREIENLKQNSLSEKELALVKGQLKGSVLLSSDHMENRQESIGRNEIIFGRYVPVEEVLEQIDRVTTERIHELAKRMFVPENEGAVTIGRQRLGSKALTIF